MANVLLGVTGSVAAIYTPELHAELTDVGHAVKIVATRSACYFFDPAQIAPTKEGRRTVILDADEWPAEGYARGDAVLHIELRRWADVLLIAPLDANTLAKLALGICDNCLTCVWRAWEKPRPIVLAPAMNTRMWEHPATNRHLRQIGEDFGLTLGEADDVTAEINASAAPLRIVGPVSKRLACDEVGVGALAGRVEILAALRQFVQAPGSPRPGDGTV